MNRKDAKTPIKQFKNESLKRRVRSFGSSVSWSATLRALYLVSSLIVSHIPPTSFARTQRERAEALLKNSFGENVRVSSGWIILNSVEKESLKTLTKFEYPSDTLQVLVASNGRSLGYAVVDDARGKDQPITYCIVVDEKLTVKDVEILTYRESYGGEVQNKSWLRQFFGKQPSDELRPMREIKNITGATVSSRSMTLNVKKILTLLNIVKQRLPHNESSRQ